MTRKLRRVVFRVAAIELLDANVRDLALIVTSRVDVETVGI